MGEDFESDHVKLMEDINEDMEDFIVTGRAESISEICEGCFTGDIFDTDTGQVAVGAAEVFIL